MESWTLSAEPHKILIFTHRNRVEEDTDYANLRASVHGLAGACVASRHHQTRCPMNTGPRGDITHRVLLRDVNYLGTLFDGRLLEWMDGAAEIGAARYVRRVVVPVAMEQVVFTQPVRVGDLVRIEAVINGIGRTSRDGVARIGRWSSRDRLCCASDLRGAG